MPRRLELGKPRAVRLCRHGRPAPGRPSRGGRAGRAAMVRLAVALRGACEAPRLPTRLHPRLSVTTAGGRCLRRPRCLRTTARGGKASAGEPDFPVVESVALPENFCIIESRDTVQARRATRRRVPAAGGLGLTCAPLAPGLCRTGAARNRRQHRRASQPHFPAHGGGASCPFLPLKQAARAGAAELTAPPPWAQIRRLRIQQRLKTGAVTEDDVTKQEFNSALPLLPPLVRWGGEPVRDEWA